MTDTGTDAFEIIDPITGRYPGGISGRAWNDVRHHKAELFSRQRRVHDARDPDMERYGKERPRGKRIHRDTGNENDGAGLPISGEGSLSRSGLRLIHTPAASSAARDRIWRSSVPQHPPRIFKPSSWVIRR